MQITDAFGLMLLLIAEGAQFMERSFLRRALVFFWIIGVAGMFCIVSYDAVRLYGAWSASPLSKFLLPPRRSPLYFFSYIGWRLFAPWLLALAVAYAASRFAKYLNARKRERFFEAWETWLLGLGIFLTGYPGFLFYFPALLIAAVALSLYYFFSNKGRVPLFYLWLPCAILAILIKQFIPSAILNNFIL